MWSPACDVIDLSVPHEKNVDVIIRVKTPSCQCVYADYCKRGGCIEGCQKSKDFQKYVQEAREKRDAIEKIGIESRIQFIE